MACSRPDTPLACDHPINISEGFFLLGLSEQSFDRSAPASRTLIAHVRRRRARLKRGKGQQGQYEGLHSSISSRTPARNFSLPLYLCGSPFIDCAKPFLRRLYGRSLRGADHLLDNIFQITAEIYFVAPPQTQSATTIHPKMARNGV